MREKRGQGGCRRDPQALAARENLMVVPDVPIRYAIVTNARTRREAYAYFPDNYAIIWQGRVEA